jgi:hemerythrin-like domain-containing protein
LLEVLEIAAASGLIVSGSLLVPDRALAQESGRGTQQKAGQEEAGEERGEKRVGATEDLMREHGVLRRALLVYAQAAGQLKRGQAIPADALHRAAGLFRRFGEDYHERALEEQHVFPAVVNAGGEPAAICRTLATQHRRGRQITDYVLAASAGTAIARSRMGPLAGVLEGMVRMYQHHTAIEDTVVFPAWKRTLTPARYSVLSEQFEALEKRMFGHDGFEEAVQRIGTVEQAFGLADLASLTAAPPPALPAR